MRGTPVRVSEEDRLIKCSFRLKRSENKRLLRLSKLIGTESAGRAIALMLDEKEKEPVIALALKQMDLESKTSK